MSLHTKAEFDALKNNFDQQIENYESSISSKIDGAIAAYLAGITVSHTANIESLLNNYNEARRTFVNSISNPTESGQDDIKITTNGFWIVAYNALEYTNWKPNRWMGYSMSGLNNYEGGHGKGPREKDNGKSGKYLMTDTFTLGLNKYPYFREKNKYLLLYKIQSFGSNYYDQSIDTPPTYKGDASITWNCTYNWFGVNNRTCGNGITSTANESIVLSKEEPEALNWIDCMSGSTIYSNNSGTLLNDDEFKWTYNMTNQSYGNTAQQCEYFRCDRPSSGASFNSYNSSGNVIKLNFIVPKITMYAGSDICVKDVASTLNTPVYYYSGLPLCSVPGIGKLNIAIRITRNYASSSDTSTSVTFMLKASQFGNNAISSESGSDVLFTKTFTKAELDHDDVIRFELDEDALREYENGMLWVKAVTSNPNDTVTLYSENIRFISE